MAEASDLDLKNALEQDRQQILELLETTRRLVLEVRAAHYWTEQALQSFAQLHHIGENISRMLAAVSPYWSEGKAIWNRPEAIKLYKTTIGLWAALRPVRLKFSEQLDKRRRQRIMGEDYVEAAEVTQEQVDASIEEFTRKHAEMWSYYVDMGEAVAQIPVGLMPNLELPKSVASQAARAGGTAPAQPATAASAPAAPAAAAPAPAAQTPAAAPPLVTPETPSGSSGLSSNGSGPQATQSGGSISAGLPPAAEVPKASPPPAAPAPGAPAPASAPPAAAAPPAFVPSVEELHEAERFDDEARGRMQPEINPEARDDFELAGSAPVEESGPAPQWPSAGLLDDLADSASQARAELHTPAPAPAPTPHASIGMSQIKGPSSQRPDLDAGPASLHPGGMQSGPQSRSQAPQLNTSSAPSSTPRATDSDGRPRITWGGGDS